MKFAGYDTVPWARDIVTTLSSMSCLKASRLVWPNSGSSSRSMDCAMAEGYLSGPGHAVSTDKASVGYQSGRGDMDRAGTCSGLRMINGQLCGVRQMTFDFIRRRSYSRCYLRVA